MKLRVRQKETKALIKLNVVGTDGGVPTFADLLDETSKAFGLEDGVSAQLSLNGKDILKGDISMKLDALGVRGGDLVYILNTSANAPQGGATAATATATAIATATATASASVSASMQEDTGSSSGKMDNSEMARSGQAKYEKERSVMPSTSTRTEPQPAPATASTLRPLPAPSSTPTTTSLSPVTTQSYASDKLREVLAQTGFELKSVEDSAYLAMIALHTTLAMRGWEIELDESGEREEEEEDVELSVLDVAAEEMLMPRLRSLEASAGVYRVRYSREVGGRGGEGDRQYVEVVAVKMGEEMIFHSHLITMVEEEEGEEMTVEGGSGGERKAEKERKMVEKRGDVVRFSVDLNKIGMNFRENLVEIVNSLAVVERKVSFHILFRLLVTPEVGAVSLDGLIDDAVLNIVMSLDVKHIMMLAMTCKQMNRVTRLPQLWSTMLKRDFGDDALGMSSAHFRDVYVQRWRQREAEAAERRRRLEEYVHPRLATPPFGAGPFAPSPVFPHMPQPRTPALPIVGGAYDLWPGGIPPPHFGGVPPQFGGIPPPPFGGIGGFGNNLMNTGRSSASSRFSSSSSPTGTRRFFP
eukprot:CAMPEP_0113880910 /NCGR_PEP_ID=MMETSP0780_2-20120614/8065_1 /TAXON_ID=652834 /ORGANISM="Palpitomonas bilix" /LENGTH=583 /DNA_ID=CAMNT_0000867673 /DNA_START=84 /DNA_END=1835 /DNA_ORIENTATION=+ /assembly_acc=CAM_ASM_000599